MTDDMVKDVSNGCAWLPREFKVTEATVASVLAMSLEQGIAVRLTEYRAMPGARAWMRAWFSTQMDDYLRRRARELDEPTAMISLTVAQDQQGSGFVLEEARVSTYPSVPKQWPERPYRALIERVMDFLNE